MKSEVLGVEEMKRVFRKLPDNMQKNVLVSTSRAGATELQSAAYAQLALAMRSRTPRAEDVVIKQRRTNSRTALQSIFDVGPTARKPQLRWLHSGTRGHPISAVVKFRTSVAAKGKKKGVRREGRVGVATGENAASAVLYSRRLDAFFGVEVFHPGQMPTFWLQVAQHRSKSAVFRQMAETYSRGLAKQVRVLASSKYTGKLLRRLAA